MFCSYFAWTQVKNKCRIVSENWSPQAKNNPNLVLHARLWIRYFHWYQLNYSREHNMKTKLHPIYFCSLPLKITSAHLQAGQAQPVERLPGSFWLRNRDNTTCFFASNCLLFTIPIAVSSKHCISKSADHEKGSPQWTGLERNSKGEYNFRRSLYCMVCKVFLIS